MLDLNIQSFQEIPFFEDVYHLKVIKQHFQYYFYFRENDIEEAVNADNVNYQPLNNANLLLGAFLKKLISGLEGKNSPSLHLIDSLNTTLKEWEAMFNRGGTFDTFKFAHEIIEKLKQINYPVESEIENTPDLLRAFLTVPDIIKSFIQISIFLPEKELLPFFEKLVTYLHSNKELCRYVKELKMSMCFSDREQPKENEQYRIVKLVLNPVLITNIQHPVIETLLREISNAITWPAKYSPSLDRFSLKIFDNLYMSQGNFKYKEFLELLGILNYVYNLKTNFAYIND